MTEDSSLPNSKSDLTAILKSVPDLYLILDNHLNIVEVSDAYLNATKVTRDKILGRGIFEVFPDDPDDPAATGVDNLRASLERVLRYKIPDSMAVQKYAIRVPESEGGGFEEHYWSPINSPVLDKDNQVKYIIHRVEDVTDFIRLKQSESEQHKMADALRTRAGEMEVEIFQRAQEIQEANKHLRKVNKQLAEKELEQEYLYKKLKSVDELKTQFFANISHELRTPLTLILGIVRKMLLNNNPSSDSYHDLKIMERNAFILLKHVNDLLDVAKLEAGKMEANYEEVDLAKIFRVTTSNFDSLAHERTIKYTVKSPKELLAKIDPDKLQRIILNLLSNAFKFTPDGGKITCTLDVKNKNIVLVISDTGPGIPEELREVIFERFRQGEGHNNRRFGGTGLGLAIVKDFVELQNGRIRIENVPDGGAQFVVEIPLSADLKASMQKPDKKKIKELSNKYMEQTDKATLLELEAMKSNSVNLDPPSGKPVVLVVEDNQDMNRFIVEILSPDFDVISAIDGKDGFEKAKMYKPDLILSDIMMPKMSGDQLIREIRKINELKNIPIIFLSAKAEDEERIKLLREGAQDYIMKPFSQEELKARIANLIKLKMVEADLERIAYFDILTGLANRVQLMQKMNESIENARQKRKKLAVFFLDLDQFKMINDTLGHHIGDLLLQAISKRLKNIIQKNDIVSRLGGDEFVILIDEIKDLSEISRLAKRILDKIKEPVVIDDHEVFISASLGISLFPENGNDANTLLRHADIAMYHAKGIGRDNYQFCTPEIALSVQEKMNIENELRNVLKQQNFILHFQPQVDLKTGAIAGIETLIRLPSNGKLLLPEEFIQIAEETGLIVPIGEWVLYTACAQYKKWVENEFKALHLNQQIKLAVNVSARQLKETNFLQMISDVLNKTKIDPRHLELEITENPVIDNIESSVEILQELKKMKVNIAIDDFGGDYSSLTYLRRFPIDTLKLDLALIQNMLVDKRDSAIITAIINMAHAMDVSVVAEGAETEAQINFLINLGCDKMQSHYFCVPLPANELIKFIQNKKI